MPKVQTDLTQKYEEMSAFEKSARERGISLIAGIDEAGRGPLAGPVVAAAVILDPQQPILGVDDSKKLSPAKRAVLRREIEEKALAVGVGMADVETIDRINILEATKLAMRRAVEALALRPELLLIDAVRLGLPDMEEQAIIKGDALSVSIAAASIIAKETRDDILKLYGRMYPEYGFESHKGYGTKAHMEAIERYGILPVHRRTFLKKFLARENGR